MKTQKLPIAAGTPDSGIAPGWRRELSEWSLVVATMAIAIWVFFTLAQFVLDFAIWLPQLIN